MARAPLPEAATPLERVRSILVDRDYQEAITYSFVDAALLQELDADSQPVALANPVLYLIDGFRYGFIGHADGSLVIGAALALPIVRGLREVR